MRLYQLFKFLFDVYKIVVYIIITTTKFSKRLCYRQLLLLKSSRQCFIPRLLIKIIFLLLFLFVVQLFYYSILIFHLNYCCYQSSNIIISLTTTPKRFQYELPFTIHSLLTQTKLPKEIRIYLSPTATVSNQKNLTLEYLKLYVKHVDSSVIIRRLFDKLVQIRFEEQDYGPATKFLPIIKEFHSITSNISKTQAIMICDDDHYYHHDTIATLDKYSNKYKNNIIGLRGWRIREDLIWGVSGEEEYSYHIIESYRISEIYQVGVVTANHGYLIRPSFFDSHIYLDFNQVSNDIQRVDDIWLNGHASKCNISRFIIPTCCNSISITQTHELENYLSAHQITRSSANNHALKWFTQSWEKDLWYKFNGKNQPKYHNWFMTIFQQWMNIISRLKFIIYCGFI